MISSMRALAMIPQIRHDHMVVVTGELPRDASGQPRAKPLYTETEKQARMDNLLLLRFDSEQEIIDAMELTWERMKIVIEPSCAVPMATILRNPDVFRGKRVGVIITGGNVDLDKLPWIKG